MAEQNIDIDELVRDHLSSLGAEAVPDQEIVTRQVVSTWLTHLDEGLGGVTSRDIRISAGDVSKACSRSSILDVAGVAVTGTNSSVMFLLSDYVCDLGITRTPAWTLATPLGDDPVFATTRTQPSVNPAGRRDLQITVYTWNPDGTPKPRQVVAWRILVAGSVPGIFPGAVG